ncbi:MAG: ABC transporter permease [Saccharofermentans sp.]|nr:ABC transporter permease [Saccharofermentans sp.]
MSFKSSVKEYFSETGRLNKQRLKKMVLNAPFWFILIAVLLIVIGSVRIAVLTNARHEQYMAQVWGQGSDTDYRQVTVFARGARTNGEASPLMYIDSASSLRKSDIPLIRAALQNVVDTGAARGNTGLNSDGSPRGWEDCYSTCFKTSVCQVTDNESDIVTPLDGVNVVGVGGNFRALHPFRYLSGGFLPEIIEDRYQIVINDALAWRFFNSYDVVGEKIDIEGVEFTIVGVVEEGTTSIDRATGATDPRVYMYFDTVAALYKPAEDESFSDAETTTPAADDGEAKVVAIQCYEAILPELVKGVANTDIKNALPEYSMTDPKIYTMSNTGRFFVTRVWDWVFPIGENTTKFSAFEFPYWEIAAQITTDKIAVDVLLIAGGGVLLIAGGIMALLRSRKLRKVIEAVEEESKTEEDSL